MSEPDDVLISLKPKYAAHVFGGEKTVELRKRKPNIAPGARIWIYVTAPIAALKGYAHLNRVVTGMPSFIWKEFGDRAGVSKKEFEDYFAGNSIAHALVLSNIHVLKRPILLKNMREVVRGFHPPQFFCRLNGAVAELRLNSRKYYEP